MIRPETLADSAIIEQLRSRIPEGSIYESYRAPIVNALRRAGQLSVSLVAQDDDEIVGTAVASLPSFVAGNSGHQTKKAASFELAAFFDSK